MPDSSAIIVTEVTQNTETYYVRIDGIHEIMDSEHGLVNLNQSGGVEILNDMIPDVGNEISDNIRMHIDDKNIYQTIDADCIGIQVEQIEHETTNMTDQQYFITSDCVGNK